MNRILVIRGGAIGDFVLTLPAIGLLRNAWPQSYLEILGYEHITALAKNRFYADATRSLEHGKLARFFARGAKLPQELVGYFMSFDLIVSYLFDPDRIFVTNLRRCGNFAFIAGPSRPDESSHAAFQLAAALTDIPLEPDDSAAKIFPSSDDRKFAQHFVSGATSCLIGIHPGSGSETKNWSLACWQTLATDMLEFYRDTSLVVFGGESDRVALQKIRQRLPAHRAVIAEDLELPQVAAIAERCALFIGHDSGISHIAAAVGTPSLLLFGPTDPAVWAPKNPRVHVMRREDRRLDSITVPEVLQRVHDTLQQGIDPLRADAHRHQNV